MINNELSASTSNTTSTTTITFRISKQYEEYLRKRAKQDKVSINIIANKILGEYIEWLQFIEKFGTIILSKDAFSALVKVIDEKELISLAIKIGQKTPKEFILFKWKKITDRNVIEFIKMFSHHCMNGECDYNTTPDNKITISLKHNMGRKVSIFLKYYIQSIIQETLKRDSETEIMENLITINF